MRKSTNEHSGKMLFLSGPIIDYQKHFGHKRLLIGIQGDGVQGGGISQPVGLLASALGSHDRRAAQNAARPRAAGLAAGADDLSTAVRASRAVTSLRRVDRLTPAWTGPADLQDSILFDLDVVRDVRRLSAIAASRPRTACLRVRARKRFCGVSVHPPALEQGRAAIDFLAAAFKDPPTWDAPISRPKLAVRPKQPALAQPSSAMAYVRDLDNGIRQRTRQRAIRMGASSRAFLFGALIAMFAGSAATGQTALRPPIGGIGQLPDAMIFYVAHGATGRVRSGLLRLDRRRRHRAMGHATSG